MPPTVEPGHLVRNHTMPEEEEFGQEAGLKGFIKTKGK
jgi:hypothetical protein